MNAAEYICRILEAYDVKHIFGLFGDIQTDFAHAVRKSKIKWVGIHNEKSGGFMADIYARVSRKPGVIFTTLGPGGTNLTSALANAKQDRSPMIAISDQVPLKDFHLETHQYVDFAKAFHPSTGITKHASVIKKISDIPKVFKEAFEIALSEPKGPVHISIPADLFGKEIEKISSIPQIKLNENYYFPKSTYRHEKLVKTLTSDKKGLVIVGGIIERSNTQKLFISFIEKFNLPVLTTFRGKNSLPSNHPNLLGTISRHLGNALDDIIKSADYILLIGYDYNEGVKPSNWKGKEKNIININPFDNRVKGIFYPPSLFINIEKFLSQINKKKNNNGIKLQSYLELKNKLKTIVCKALDVKHKHLHPQRIIDAVNEIFIKDSIIICDVGLNKYYSGLLLEAHESRQIIFSNGQSAMAFTSGAMGAKLANPKKDVVVLTGDGGLLMNPQEIITAAQFKQVITWIVFNNGGLGLVEQAQMKKNPKVHGVHFNHVFFTKLAEAFGINGYSINPHDNLYELLKQIKESSKASLIDIPIEYTAPSA